MKISKSGATLAAAAASLLLAGAVAHAQGTAPAAAPAGEKGMCVGANACKGQGACKSAANACKGQNACKGKGFQQMTQAECGKVQGAKFEMPKKS
jgi:hypothetical protein